MLLFSNLFIDCFIFFGVRGSAKFIFCPRVIYIISLRLCWTHYTSHIILIEPIPHTFILFCINCVCQLYIVCTYVNKWKLACRNYKGYVETALGQLWPNAVSKKRLQHNMVSIGSYSISYIKKVQPVPKIYLITIVHWKHFGPTVLVP